MIEREWLIKEYEPSLVDSLSRELNISSVLSKLLIARKHETLEDATLFLKKDFDSFHSPFLMKDVEVGANVLLDAIEKKEKILVWGDYDVDGVTSVTVLIKYIKSIGGECDFYIPRRDDDGYGLNDRVISEFASRGFSLIITVDSGITAIAEIEHAKNLGFRVIVTDHHECRCPLPSADAVINPKRPDCEYPFKELAGVGVVLKFISAVEMIRTSSSRTDAITRLVNEYSDFVSVGTIADVMPITDENRLIVSHGLSAIEKTKNLGLQALVEEAGVLDSTSKKKHVSSTTVGYILAPRINAAGRMESSEIAVNLFMTEKREEAALLAKKLGEINKNRQVAENEILISALDKVKEQCDLSNDRVLVLEDDNWHHGIIGIVSSRITERFNLPSVLISFKNEIATSDPDAGKGSARSIKGMNLVEALKSCSDLLVKFGGHELAAGLSIKRADLPEFRRRMNEYAEKALGEVTHSKTLEIDCEISHKDISISLANEISRLEPFGLSNPVPLFAISDVRISSVIPISNGKHTKLIVEKKNSSIVALLFGTPTSSFKYIEGDFVDLAFNLDVNNFKNQENVQLIVRDIRPSKIARDLIDQHIYKYTSMIECDNYTCRSSDIPTRADFAQVYTTLKNLSADATSDSEFFDVYLPWLLKLSQKKYSSDVPLYKALIILDVLQESGLVEIKEKKNALNCTLKTKHINKNDGKVILENTPTIVKLLKKVNNI